MTLIEQYRKAKAETSGCILLFMVGDFYEAFEQDARTIAKVLNLAVTCRSKGEESTAMAGFPYHQLESYLAKLLAAGLRVAICERETP